jgi:hypothetical protein
MSTDICLGGCGLPLESSNLSENNAGVDFRKASIKKSCLIVFQIAKSPQYPMLLSAAGCVLFHHGDCFEHPTGQQLFVR